MKGREAGMILDLWMLPSWSRGFPDTPHPPGIVLVEVCEPMLLLTQGQATVYLFRERRSEYHSFCYLFISCVCDCVNMHTTICGG